MMNFYSRGKGNLGLKPYIIYSEIFFSVSPKPISSLRISSRTVTVLFPISGRERPPPPRSESIPTSVLKRLLENRHVLAFQWFYELAQAMLKFKLSTSSFSKLSGRALATSQRKITMHKIKVFLETLHSPQDPTLPETKEIWSPAQKKRVQQLPPRIAAYPLSLCQRLIWCPLSK